MARSSSPAARRQDPPLMARSSSPAARRQDPPLRHGSAVQVVPRETFVVGFEGSSSSSGRIHRSGTGRLSRLMAAAAAAGSTVAAEAAEQPESPEVRSPEARSPAALLPWRAASGGGAHMASAAKPPPQQDPAAFFFLVLLFLPLSPVGGSGWKPSHRRRQNPPLRWLCWWCWWLCWWCWWLCCRRLSSPAWPAASGAKPPPQQDPAAGSSRFQQLTGDIRNGSEYLKHHLRHNRVAVSLYGLSPPL